MLSEIADRLLRIGNEIETCFDTDGDRQQALETAQRQVYALAEDVEQS